MSNWRPPGVWRVLHRVCREANRGGNIGHFGDRIGRKATLIATLLITGFATIAVELVPGYASIGIWGAVLLTFIRLVQGIGVGGEWGG